jgi:hypothetical protein
MRKKGIALEHRVDRPPVWRCPCLINAIDEDGAAVGSLESGDQPESGGLATPRRPEKRKKLATLDAEVYVVDSRILRVVLGKID